MFDLAILLGIYSYGIFIIGISGILTRTNIALFTCVYALLLLLFLRQRLFLFLRKVFSAKISSVNVEQRKGFYFIIALLVLLALVNLIGALGPELAFDALWYHLTLPKLFLLHHTIYHIPGGLLYYSDMPKLGEMFYVGALSLGNEIYAKVMHYGFGLLTAIAVYLFVRKFYNPFIALIAVVIFYSNLVVDWESITAYIDLTRSFFEVLALYGFINWYQTQKWKWLVLSAIMLGLAITTKLLAVGSLVIFTLLFGFLFLESHYHKNAMQLRWKKLCFILFIYWLIALIIPLPWFLFAYSNTGNPVYPFLSAIYPVNPNSPNPSQIVISLWRLFMHSSDPISPLYLIFLPLLFVTFSHFRKEIKLIVYYCGLSLVVWYFTPQTGGGRFIVPYLSAFSIVCAGIYAEIQKFIQQKMKKSNEWQYVSQFLFVVVIFTTVISIGYRFLANRRYIPVILGKESKQTFLTDNLNYAYGDFSDTDQYFAHHITSSDTVLLYGFHNLYYVNFPFIDSSWVKQGDAFTYIAVQNATLPKKYINWQLIYKNDKTLVQLYKPQKGTCLSLCRY